MYGNIVFSNPLGKNMIIYIHFSKQMHTTLSATLPFFYSFINLT